MKTKLLAVVAAIIIIGMSIVVVFSYENNESRSNENVLTDMAGRPVEIPDTLDRGIVTFGSTDPLRFASYFNLNEYIIEVDKGDVTDNKNGRAYSYAYNYDDLTNYHADNTISAEDVERIINMQPSLVIVGGNVYQNYSNLVETMAKAVPVFVLKSMSTNAAYWDPTTYELNNDFTEQITKLGAVVGKAERAAELIAGFNKYIQELKSMIGTTNENIMTAGLTISGSNPLNVTFPFYAPLEINGLNNVYNQSNDTKVELDAETIAKLDITMMLIDPSSSDKIVDNHTSQLVMGYIYSVNNDNDPTNDIKMHVVLPIVWDGCNWDVSLAGSFYVSYLLYNSMTLDEVKDRIVEIFEFFYGYDGTTVLDDMTQFFIGKSSNAGIELPLFGQVEVVRNSTGGYIFEALSQE